MKKTTAVLIVLMTFLLLTSCSSKPTAVQVPDTPEPTPELIESAPTMTVEVEETLAENAVFEIEETKTTLLVYSGDVRLSRDGGESWSYSDTGLWLESGDRIQISDGGLAIILFPDGSLIRLEGFTDFELVLNDFDFEAGTKRVIARVLEGAALISTVPLPNAESLFQLWLMTSLIDLPFDPFNAIPLDQAETIPEERRIVFGATMREQYDGESLFSYSDSVLPDFYVLEIIDGDYVLIKTQPEGGQYSQFDIPFRENIEHEFVLEGLLDMAAGVIELSRSVESITDLDFFGYSMIEEGELSDNQILYSVFPVAELDEFLQESNDPAEQAEFVSYVKQTPSYKRYKLHYRYYKDIADIFSSEILLMLDKYNLGCDIKTGLGCPLPPDCNRETGEGCTLLESGCNPITRVGCRQAKLSCIAYTNCDLAPCGRRPVVSFFCRPRVRSYCDPDIAGDCDKYLFNPVTPTGSDTTSETGSDPDATSSADTGGTDTASGTIAGTDAEITSNITYYSVGLPLDLVQNPDKAGEPLVDPNNPQSCLPFYNDFYWLPYDLTYGSAGDWDDDEDIEWCTCTASTEGYPPPPPWMDLTYRCWCSDPGAH